MALDCLVGDFQDDMLGEDEKLVLVDSWISGSHMGILNKKKHKITWLPLEGSLMHSAECWLSQQLRNGVDS